MYSQIIYLIAALLVFTLQQPGNEPLYPLGHTLLAGLGVFAVYVLVCRAGFLRLKRWMDWPFSGKAVVSAYYHRLQARLSILALIALAIHVYVLDIKFYLLAFVPGFEDYYTISGLIGLAVYLVHLGVVWYWSYPVYRWIHTGTAMTRWGFLLGHVGFQSAILIPWLMISVVSDLLQWIRIPGFLTSQTAETLAIGMVLLLFVLFAPWLVVRLWGCRSIPRSTIREELESFSRKYRFQVGDFMYWPLFGGEVLTAAVMGILPRLRYILVTRGLISLLNIDELKAVVAHEMGHVRRYHLLFYLLFFLAFSVLAYSLQDIPILLLLKQSSLYPWILSPDSNQLTTAFSLVYSLSLILVMVVYFRFIIGFFLRNSERQADLYALELIGHPYTLVSSLEKIAFHSGRIEDLPSWHHYSIRERIEFLLDSYRNPALIRRHNLKLYSTAAAFLFAVTALSALGLHFQSTPTFQTWYNEVQIQFLERELRLEPGNPEIYAAYGVRLYEQKRYPEAEAIMKKALEIAPDRPDILNNLAWFYATTPPPHFDPRAALSLARKAAAGAPDTPHILDTLAEAYHANGLHRQALETIDRAIGLNPENYDYYLNQKQKFVDAIDKAGNGKDGRPKSLQTQVSL